MTPEAIARAARTFAAWTLRTLFYAALFVGVVIAHVALTAAFRGLGWSDGIAMLVAGACVFAVVLVAGRLRRRQRSRKGARRRRRRAPTS